MTGCGKQDNNGKVVTGAPLTCGTRPAHMITKEYVYFTLNGFTYRTNGEDVEAAGGNRWNKTNSLPIILHARDIFAQTAARIRIERSL